MIRDIETMFAHFIQGYSGARPRQAESSDTRQEIRRHDPDQQGRKGGKEDAPAELFSDEDKASVSVTALRAFLEEFLKTLPDTARTTPDDMNENKKPHISAALNTKAKQPATGTAMQAHSAYAHAAQTSPQHEAPMSSKNAQQAASSLGLSADEVRTIHALLEDLKILAARGIETLELERSATFLQSLVNAVLRVK